MNQILERANPERPRNTTVYPTAVEQFDSIYQQEATERSIAVERARTMAAIIDRYISGNRIGAEIEQLIAQQKTKQQRPLTENERLYFQSYYRSRIEEARSFFVTASPDFPASPLVRVAKDFDELTPPTDLLERRAWESALNQYMEAIVILSFDQHWKDPEEFVSHDFAHGLRCADYALELMSALDQTSNQDNTSKNFHERARESRIIQEIAEKYGITAGEAVFLASQITSCHDCGYPHIGNRAKSSHTVASAELFSDTKITTALQTLITSPTADKAAIQRDLYEALAYHGADIAPEKFDARIITNRGTYLAKRGSIEQAIAILHSKDSSEIQQPRTIQKIELTARYKAYAEELQGKDAEISVISANHFLGRSIDALTEDGTGKESLGLEFRLGHAKTNPLLSLLRLADNLDIAKNRLGPIKNTDLFTELLQRIGEGGDLHTAAVEQYALGKDVYRQWKRRVIAETLETSPAAAALPSHKDISQTDVHTITKERVAEVASFLQTWDMRYAGSSSVIDDVKIYRESETVVICITVNDRYSKTRHLEIDAQWYNRLGQQSTITTSIAEHQIFRLRQALEVNELSEMPVTIFLIDSEGNPVE